MKLTNLWHKANIVLREFCWETDVTRVLDFQEDLYKINVPGFIYSTLFYQEAKRRLKAALGVASERLFVARNDHEIIGFIWATVTNHFLSYSQIGVITQIYVIQQYRNQGIAKLLLNEAEEFFLLNRVNKVQLNVTLSNIPAFTLYRELGFLPTRATMEKTISAGS